MNTDIEEEHLIGIISDTHGLIRRDALERLEGSEMIIHAGDIGGPEILDILKTVAPVVAVSGNNDHGEWARRLPKVKIIEIDGSRIAVVHILRDLKLDIIDLDCIISGHSHRASVKRKNEVLYLNPGTAGPRRFGHPATLAKLRVQGKAMDAEIIRLKII